RSPHRLSRIYGARLLERQAPWLSRPSQGRAADAALLAPDLGGSLPRDLAVHDGALRMGEDRARAPSQNGSQVCKLTAILPAMIFKRREGGSNPLLAARGVVFFWLSLAASFLVLNSLLAPGRTLQDAIEAELLQTHLGGGYQLKNPPLYEWLLWAV